MKAPNWMSFLAYGHGALVLMYATAAVGRASEGSLGKSADSALAVFYCGTGIGWRYLSRRPGNAPRR